MLRLRLPLFHLRLVDSSMQVRYLADREVLAIVKYRLGMKYDKNVLKAAHTKEPYIMRGNQEYYIFRLVD